MAEKNITLYSVACGSYAEQYKDFFMAIAHITGGQYVALKDANLLSKVIIGGAREEMSLQQLMDEVNHEVMQEFHARGGKVDEDAMATRVETTLKKRKRTTKAMTTDTDALPDVSEKSKRIAELASMADVRTELARPETSVSPSPMTTTPVKTHRKRKLDLAVSTPSVSAKVAKTSRITAPHSDDVARTRSRSKCPITGICAVCNPSTSSRSCCAKISGRKSPTPTSSPPSTPTRTTAPATAKKAEPSLAATPSPKTVTIVDDIAVNEGKTVSSKQVRRLVKKSIAINKLRKM
ncbi:protein let-653-like [Ptychodera flava]|uniref:protein let-653-like n=1 Tax=Ptychodera flava TaxID=63121 RepID=UPI00396A24BF